MMPKISATHYIAGKHCFLSFEQLSTSITVERFGQKTVNKVDFFYFVISERDMSKRIRKISQLDSIRALAVLIVILYHYFPEFQLGRFSYGWIGVDIFFIISGYLITAILLEQKNAINDKFLIARNFLAKRALRLLPPYYLLLSAFAVLIYFYGMQGWDYGKGLYYYTYTQNILFFNEGMKGQLNHTWTLAVEEQFYLFWPWLVIYISNVNLIRGLITVILSSLLLKAFSGIDIRMLIFSHFDTLGSGALIALVMKEKGKGFFLFANKIKIFTICTSLIVFFAALIYEVPAFIVTLAILLLSISLLIGCIYEFNGALSKVFNNAQLQYLGRISYGLYLYHKPIPYLLKLVLNKYQIGVNNYVQLFLSISITILVSHFSYSFLEKRFLKLKGRFDL